MILPQLPFAKKERRREKVKLAGEKSEQGQGYKHKAFICLKGLLGKAGKDRNRRRRAGSSGSPRLSYVYYTEYLAGVFERVDPASAAWTTLF